MESVDISSDMKLLFRERCLAVVNRGIGKIALSPTHVVEVSVEGFFSGERVVDATGSEVILWTDIFLGDDNQFRKTTDLERAVPEARPTVASEEVMRQYLLEDLRQHFTPEEDIGASILVDYLQRWSQAEALGLLTVTSDEILGAVSTMDRLIEDHDAKQA